MCDAQGIVCLQGDNIQDINIYSIGSQSILDINMLNSWRNIHKLIYESFQNKNHSRLKTSLLICWIR